MFRTQADMAGEMTGDLIMDYGSGFAINRPLGPQDYPGWHLVRPEVVERIRQLREQHGIVIEDDQFCEPDQFKPYRPREGRGKRAGTVPKAKKPPASGVGEEEKT